MAKTLIIVVRIWLILLALWFLGCAGLFFYQDYQIHLAVRRSHRINAAIAVLQGGSQPRVGGARSLDDLVKRGLIAPTDSYSPESGLIYSLLRVPPAGQAGAMVKYQDAIGRWYTYPCLNPSWHLYGLETAPSQSPN